MEIEKVEQMPQQFQRKWIIPIFLLGCLAGAIFIAPFFNLQITTGSNHTSLLHETAKILHISAEILAGTILGGLISLLLIPLIFYKDPKMKEIFKILEVGGWNQFIHPTTFPMTIAVIWFLLFIALDFIFSKISGHGLGDFVGIILVVPLCFLFGLSGFQIIRRNELVGRFGTIRKGFWAYLNGTLGMLFGWGGLVYLLLAWIFHWK